jgi:glycosyltransferase involved in cell wall biosynthesis
VLLDYRPALRERTGVGEYVHEAARHLVATAPPAETLILFSASWRDRLTPGIIPGATVIDRTVPVSLLNFAWHRLAWPPVERLTGSRFDVVQSMHPLLIPSRHAARIVTIHDLDFLDHPERAEREIRRDYPTLARSHAARADQIVVNSRHTADAVTARFGIHSSRISVCPPGAPAWPRRGAEPTSGGCVLFLGTVAARKNPTALVHAYERLIARHPDAPPLALVGRVTDDAAAVVERIRRGPLAGRVELPGYVDEAARLDWFRRALVFVLPSHAEGFGMPVLEAMAAGVPVIAANRGAIPEVVGRAGRLIDPDHPDALAAALAEILSDRSLRERMADEGYRRAQQYSWASTAANLREAWTLALEHQRQRHG